VLSGLFERFTFAVPGSGVGSGVGVAVGSGVAVVSGESVPSGEAVGVFDTSGSCVAFSVLPEHDVNKIANNKKITRKKYVFFISSPFPFYFIINFPHVRKYDSINALEKVLQFLFVNYCFLFFFPV
jgi:hypothetical protein